MTKSKYRCSLSTSPSSSDVPCGLIPADAKTRFKFRNGHEHARTFNLTTNNHSWNVDGLFVHTSLEERTQFHEYPHERAV